MADQQAATGSSGLDTNSVDINSEMLVDAVTEYMKYIKLAVAVAIIRSRPASMTGRQYAEQLCARYQQTQLDWRHEAQRLRHQLSVVLQQKPLLDQLDQQHKQPSSSLQDTSCCSKSTPSSSGAGGGLLQSRHMAFLAGVLTLNSVSARRATATPHVVAATSQLVLDAVLRRLGQQHSGDIMSQSAAVHAVEVVARCADVIDDDQVRQVVQRFTCHLVTSVLNNSQLNQSAQHQSACDYLLSLCTSKSLQSTVLDVLLNRVSELADQLCRAQSDVDDDDDDDGGDASSLPAASQLENVAYLLDCVERMIVQDTAAADARLASELRRRLSSQLELSLRHIASAFPLYAYRVWQLGAGLADSLQPSEGN